MNRRARQILACVVVVALFVASRLLPNPTLPRPIFWTILGSILALFAASLVYDVGVRRSKGQSWNEVLAQDKKLMTGSVWRDGGLLLAAMFVCFAVVALLMIYAF